MIRWQVSNLRSHELEFYQSRGLYLSPLTWWLFCTCLHPTALITVNELLWQWREFAHSFSFPLSPRAFFFFPASLRHKAASAEKRGLRPTDCTFSLHDIIIKLSTLLSTMADRSENMSQFHGKKPCRACTDFKSWMRQGNKTKSTAVRLNFTIGF